MGNILITGAAGFIGANFLYKRVDKFPDDNIVVLDLLTYAGNYLTIKPLADQNKIKFIKGDISDSDLIKSVFKKYKIETVLNFAAESHVDRSIHNSKKFVTTNIVGTHVLLSEALVSWENNFIGKHFHHISTDEVYGDLDENSPPFSEEASYAPNSPYSASKASSDHLVRAFTKTYELPTTISNCSNNYGPYQFPEKLIPLMLTNALEGKKLPIYGNGSNVRDWLHVDDHCEAIMRIIDSGKIGSTYNIGGNNQVANIDLVLKLCDLLDEKISKKDEFIKIFPECSIIKNKQSRDLIEFIKDRPGHDKRYAIDAKKIANELGFSPQISFLDGLGTTIDWYLKNVDWWRTLLTGEYHAWLKKHYG
jgi:dTDP-glucose 4,6-dehydratase